MRTPHFKSAGERKFNWQTYTGLGYLANVGLSLGAVYWAERMKSGQWFIGKVAQGFEKLGVQSEKTKFVARKTFFLFGGFAVIPFMKALEDNRTELVKKYNREIYGPGADTDPLIQQSERELEASPRQGWASIITGRALALLPFYGTIMLLWNRTSILSQLTNPKLAALGKAEIAARDMKGGVEFAELTSKGWYFDNPLSHLSRDVGKLISSKGKYFDNTQSDGIAKVYHGALSLIGKPMRLLPESQKAVASIEEMERLSPGAIQSVKEGKHDPIQAVLPYYAISEAITSAMVAWGLFVITRITGPFFDKKPHGSASAASAPEATNARTAPTLAVAHAGPATRIAAASAEREQATLAPHAVAQAR